MAFGHIRRTQTHRTEPRNASKGQPGIKDERLAGAREEGRGRGEDGRRRPEEPRPKGCEGVLNETHSTRYHQRFESAGSLQRGPRTHAQTHINGTPPTEITEKRIGAFR